MQILRTPDARFANLPGYTFAPHYVEIPSGDGARLRVHYVDEGPASADPVLCLHGEPSWSYLYRKMIPVLVAAGHRVVAPDLVGFGRSDKPSERSDYSYQRHVDWLRATIEVLDLHNITLVCQDWGGLLGLTLPLQQPERTTRLLVMNTGLGTGTVTEGFKQWRAYANSQPDMAIGKLFLRGNPGMTAEEAAAYDAPFPDVRYKAGVRRFPNLVPDSEDAPGAELSRQAARFWSERWQGDSFMAIGMQDPVLGPPAMQSLRKLIRGCPEPLEVADGGHFVQERGGPVAEAALRHFGLR